MNSFVIILFSTSNKLKCSLEWWWIYALTDTYPCDGSAHASLTWSLLVIAPKHCKRKYIFITDFTHQIFYKCIYYYKSIQAVGYHLLHIYLYFYSCGTIRLHLAHWEVVQKKGIWSTNYFILLFLIILFQQF